MVEPTISTVAKCCLICRYLDKNMFNVFMRTSNISIRNDNIFKYLICKYIILHTKYVLYYSVMANSNPLKKKKVFWTTAGKVAKQKNKKYIITDRGDTYATLSVVKNFQRQAHHHHQTFPLQHPR